MKKIDYESCQHPIDQIVSGIFLEEKECPKHGKTKHSSCSFTDVSICIECLKERRFFKQGDTNE